jgi:hypothetical protein
MHGTPTPHAFPAAGDAPVFGAHGKQVPVFGPRRSSPFSPESEPSA